LLTILLRLFLNHIPTTDQFGAMATADGGVSFCSHQLISARITIGLPMYNRLLAALLRYLSPPTANGVSSFADNLICHQQSHFPTSKALFEPATSHSSMQNDSVLRRPP
jgi:hypothetical protein